MRMAISLAPDPKERREFGFRALRKIKIDDSAGDGDDVPKNTPLQVQCFVVPLTLETALK